MYEISKQKNGNKSIYTGNLQFICGIRRFIDIRLTAPIFGKAYQEEKMRILFSPW
jgi:hypothetical protein